MSERTRGRSEWTSDGSELAGSTSKQRRRDIKQRDVLSETKYREV